MRKPVLSLALALVITLDLLLAGRVYAASHLDTQSSAASVSGNAIVQTALRYVGYPYTTVGNSPSTGFSCIGFVSYVYQVNGIPLPDDLWAAMAYAPAVPFSDLQPGDILWFQNTVWAGLSHTAIYLGGGRFVHAEWYNRGVVISSFTGDPVDGDYWTAHYLGASRPWAGTSTAPPSPLSTPPPPSTRAQPLPVRPKLRVGPHALVNVTGLNVRVRPSLFGPIRKVATEGTTVVVLKQYRTWDWVQLQDGSFGWITELGIGTPTAPHRGGAHVLALGRVQVSALRVHLRPSWAAPARANAYRGQRLLVLQRWNGWLWVAMSDGTHGWVRAAFVSAGQGLAAAAANQSTTGPIVPVRHLDPWVTAGARLRARPGLHARVITLAAPGTRLAVLGAWGKWLYGRFHGGQAGWVYGAYVHR